VQLLTQLRLDLIELSVGGLAQSAPRSFELFAVFGAQGALCLLPLRRSFIELRLLLAQQLLSLPHSGEVVARFRYSR
jgi:hypothetical protein